MSADFLFTCDRCGQPIGVYEPAVFVVAQAVHETAEAAHPELVRDASERYHRACHAALSERSREQADR